MQSICWNSGHWSNSDTIIASEKMQGRRPAVQKLETDYYGSYRRICLELETRISAELLDTNAAEQAHDPGATWLKVLQYMNYSVPTAVRAEPFQLRLIFCQAVQPWCRKTSPAQCAVEWKENRPFHHRRGPDGSRVPQICQRCAARKEKGKTLSLLHMNHPTCAQPKKHKNKVQRTWHLFKPAGFSCSPVTHQWFKVYIQHHSGSWMNLFGDLHAAHK